ncbi:hypothetical protein BGX33_002745 [Mortierella sp. NVP41]|nr:hypothetical protein BGX33_002745 [Mortierella sp. NVP41]
MEESANPSSEASEEADVGEEGEQEGEIEEGDEGLQSWIEEPGDDDQDRARIATGDGDLGDIMDLEYEEEEEEGPDGFDQIKDWSQTADDGEAEGERDIEERARQDDYEDHSPLQLGIVEDKEDYEATDDQDDDFDRRPEFYTLPERYRDSRQQQQQQ